jgi:hypothetical protein
MTITISIPVWLIVFIGIVVLIPTTIALLYLIERVVLRPLSHPRLTTEHSATNSVEITRPPAMGVSLVLNAEHERRSRLNADESKRR